MYILNGLSESFRYLGLTAWIGEAWMVVRDQDPGPTA